MSQGGLLWRMLCQAKKVTLTSVSIGCVAHCCWEYLGGFALCTGPSMEPTIHDADIVLTDRTSVRKRRIEKGDVVIFRSPTRPTDYICKRVTGLEGDFIEEPPDGFSYRYVPRGSIWVEGDCKHNSNDSRNYGPVPLGLVYSRVFYKVWPIKDFGKLL